MEIIPKNFKDNTWSYLKGKQEYGGEFQRWEKRGKKRWKILTGGLVSEDIQLSNGNEITCRKEMKKQHFGS